MFPPSPPQVLCYVYLLGGSIISLLFYLFIFVSSTEPSGSGVGAWCVGPVAGLQFGVGQLGVRAPWGAIIVAAPWPLGHLTFTCNEGVYC